ncbi:MAG: hypothetical protein C0614_04450, partial [Desulfuromonas sp.]
MKRSFALYGLITVFVLINVVIWPSCVIAAPSFTSLGRIMVDGLRTPGAMDIDGAGNLYVVNSRGGEVFKLDCYGNLKGVFDLGGTGGGLAVNDDGTILYVARQHDVVMADAQSGTVLGLFTGGAMAAGVEFSGVGALDVDAFGNVFAADNIMMLVKVYSASGNFINQFGGNGKAAGQFMRIGGMAIDPSGRVVVADSSSPTTDNGKIHVFTLNSDLSVASVVAYANTSSVNFGTPPMVSPRGLSFDGQGRGYFLEFFRTSIRVTDANFRYVGTSSTSVPIGYQVGQLANIIDSAYDTVNNRLFVSCDTLRIEVFGIDGGQNPDPPVSNQAPGSATPVSPINSTLIASATPDLVFTNAEDPDGDDLTYQVVVKQGDTVAFETTVAGSDSGETTVAVTSALAENESFTWTVQAFDAELSSDVSDAAA